VELQALGPDLATGLRAALATVIPLALSLQLGVPALAWMAFGGWLATLADPGGSRERRARILCVFVVLGTLLVWGGQTVAPHRALAVLVLALVAGTASLLRALGPGPGGMGTVLAIVAAISTTVPSTTALVDAAWFAAGGSLAVLLSSILWPVWTHLPVRRAVARVYEELAAYAAEIRATLEAGKRDQAPWTGLALRHPRLVRGAIEQARAVSLAVHARRLGESPMGSNLRVLLGLGETQFLLLISLATELEALSRHPTSAEESLATVIRRDQEVRAALLARAWSPPPGESPVRSTTEAKGVSRLISELEHESAAAVTVVRVLGTDRAVEQTAVAAPPSRAEEVQDRLEAVREALTPRSPIFRHAVRVTAASAGAASLGTWLSPHHTAWVVITTLAVLQPYSGATVKLIAERVIGTLLGSLVVVGVAAWLRSPLALALLMFPLSMAAVVTRPRSYRLFTFFVTPVFVLIAMRSPGDWATALDRAGDTVLGGAVALAAAMFIYPGWEQRFGLPGALAAMLRAVESHRDLVLAAPIPRTPADAARIHHSRRTAGMAVSEAETSLERRLAEPLRRGADEERALEQITFARRLVLAVTTLDMLATHAAPGTRPPEAAIERIRTYSDLLDGASSPEQGTAADRAARGVPRDLGRGR